MKAKSRKRLLISSVAMLLVAMLALGTATFAWFTQNKKVTADGMQVTATAAKGLVITNDNGESFAPSVSFTQTADLTAVSVPYTTSDAYAAFSNYFTVTGNKRDGVWKTGDTDFFPADDATAKFTEQTSFPAAAAGEGSEASGKNNYLAVYEVGIKSTGDTISGVKGKIEMTGNGAGKDFARVALYKHANDSATDTKTAPFIVMGSEAANNEANPPIPAPNAIASDTPSVAPQKTENATSYQWDLDSNVTSSTVQWYSVLVWFEGQDTDCNDTNAGEDTELKFTFWYE